MTERARLRLPRRVLGLVAAVVVGALGCSDASSPALASGEAAKDYFPLVRGARWHYKLDLVAAATEIDVIARGDSAIQGLTAPAFVMDERAIGEAFGLAEVGPTAYVVRDGFVCRYTGLDYASPDHLKMLGEEDPTRVLPIAGLPGAEWTHETRLLQQPEQGGGGLIKWTGRTKLAGSLRVPAGTFDDVLLVETEYWDPAMDPDHPLISYQDYYARGVGLLRSVTKNEREGGTRMAEQTLLDYAFPPLEAQAR